MTQSDSNAAVPDWRRHLAELPECAPDESLWLRVQATRAAGSRVIRAPQQGFGWAWGVAAAMLVAVALVPLTRAPTVDPEVGKHAPQSGSPAAGLSVVDAGVLQLDADIERAYGRGANESEIASLWATRQRVVSSLENGTPVLVARL